MTKGWCWNSYLRLQLCEMKGFNLPWLLFSSLVKDSFTWLSCYSLIYEGNKETLKLNDPELIEVVPDFTMNLGACIKLFLCLHLFWIQGPLLSFLLQPVLHVIPLKKTVDLVHLDLQHLMPFWVSQVCRGYAKSSSMGLDLSRMVGWISTARFLVSTHHFLFTRFRMVLGLSSFHPTKLPRSYKRMIKNFEA